MSLNHDVHPVTIIFHLQKHVRGADGPTRCFNAPHMWQLGWGDPIDVNVSDLVPGQFGCVNMYIITTMLCHPLDPL